MTEVMLNRHHGSVAHPAPPGPVEHDVTDHSQDNLGEHGEPDGGWVQSHELIDTELVVVMLCRFTGSRASMDDECQARVLGVHPDEECRTFYYEREALQARQVDVFVDVPEGEVRRPFGGDEPLTQAT